MLFDRPILDTIVRYLSQHRQATVLELFEGIQKTHTISRPNFYKIISSLVDRQLLVKDGKILMLNAVWMMEYLDLGRDIQRLISDSPVLRRLEPGETQQFSADSLREIDGLRWDIYLRIMQWTDTKEMYHYTSHFYQMTGLHDTERQFWESLRMSGVAQHVVCAHKTFLDALAGQYIETYIQNPVFYGTVSEPGLPTEGYMIVIIGDRVIDCFFPPQVTAAFRFFFETVQTLDQFNSDLFRGLLYQKNTVKVTVDHNPARAKHMKIELNKIIKK